MKNLEADGASSKYWEIEVDYTTPEKEKINSYLRLGTAEQNPVGSGGQADMTESADAHRGHDLAALVQDYIDDGRDRGPHLPTQDTRDAETKRLHTKGGWRDHSDGNRISTTRGDKVEVIRGDYKLMVLGRQDDPGAAAEWDASGGLIQDGDIAPGSVTEIKWTQDPFSGTWTVTEECGKGNTITRYHGNVEEHFFGETITTRVGSAEGGTIADWSDSDAVGQTKTNPVIDERVWASAITDHKTVTGHLEEMTTVHGGFREHLSVDGVFNATTTINGAHVESGVAHFYIESTAFSSAKIELEAQPIHLQLEVAPLSVDVFVGFGIEIKIGGDMEIILAKQFEVNPFEKDEFKLTETQFNALKNSVASNETAIRLNKNLLSTKITQLSSKVDTLSASQTTVTGNQTTVAGQVSTI
ncbi:MAG: hypothetical protein R3B72_21420 [Polyangiaceae bacterium]